MKTKKVSAQAKSKEKSKTSANGWPNKRNVLYRPHRMKYVRRIDAPRGCVFCAAHSQKQGFDSLCVYKSEYSMIILNKYPYNSGHLLVLPISHQGDLLKLSDIEFADLNQTLKKALAAIQKIYTPNGVNIGLNLGAAAGAGIPEHVHYHLIPRWAGDLNFFPIIAETKVVVETLEQTYDRFMEYFKA